MLENGVAEDNRRGYARVDEANNTRTDNLAKVDKVSFKCRANSLWTNCYGCIARKLNERAVKRWLRIDRV